MTEKELDAEVEGRKELDKNPDETPECNETAQHKEHDKECVAAGAEKILDDLVKADEKLKPTKKEKIIDPLSFDGVPGLGPVGKKALEDEGINSTLALICKHPSYMAEVTGMTRQKSADAFTYMRQNLEAAGHIKIQMQTASALLKVRQKIPRVRTDCPSLDTLLNGGIESGTLTEFFGENGAGKTQLCHVLCMQVQRKAKDGGLWLDGEKERPVIVFLDTEGTVRPERFISILEGKKLIVGLPPAIKKKITEGKKLTIEEIATRATIERQQEEEARIYTDNVLVRRSPNAYDLMLQLKHTIPLIKEMNIKMIIVDSATAPFRSEYIGRGNMKAKFDLLGEFLHNAKMVAENYNIPIVLINQIYNKPDAMFGLDPQIPYGGHIFGHIVPNRIKFWKAGASKRGAKIIKSPYQPNDDSRFLLAESGLIDAS